MRVFDCNQDESEELLDFEIDAQHKWTLPGVKCDVCGATWSTTGIEYPSVDISNEPFAKEYESGWPVTLAELEQRRARIRSHFPPDAVLPPGTEFGPLTGRAAGRFPDFVWLSPWTLLIKSEAYAQLRVRNVLMPDGIASDLRFTGDQRPDLLELEIQPLALLAPASFLPNGEPCAGCGREGRRVDVPVVSSDSIPADTDMFRPRNFPTYILATERFKAAVTELNLTGLRFSELPLA